jgi:hypothetical protein
MSPGGHIGRQRGAVGAKCACSGTIARRACLGPCAANLGVAGEGLRARLFDRRRPNALAGATPAPCTQAKTQGRVTQRGGFEIVPGEYLMSTETYFVAPKCH